MAARSALGGYRSNRSVIDSANDTVTTARRPSLEIDDGMPFARSLAACCSAGGSDPATCWRASVTSAVSGFETLATPGVRSSAATMPAMPAASACSVDPSAACTTTCAVAAFWLVNRSWSRSYAACESAPGTEKLLDVAPWSAVASAPAPTSTPSQMSPTQRW